jgi:hypothetical protein
VLHVIGNPAAFTALAHEVKAAGEQKAAEHAKPANDAHIGEVHAKAEHKAEHTHTGHASHAEHPKAVVAGGQHEHHGTVHHSPVKQAVQG